MRYSAIHWRQIVITIKKNKLAEILNTFDNKDFYEYKVERPDSEKLKEELTNYVNIEKHMMKSILGIDIYQYSQYPEFEQSLIPFVFSLIYDEAVSFCLKYDKFVFQKCSENSFIEEFVHTGDGGFQISETPLHSLMLAINFEFITRAFNGYRFYPKLRGLINKPLTFRYSLVYDKIFKMDSSFFGPGLITCSRIISRDKLNRCLIDEHTFDWFTVNCQGVENLKRLTVDYLSFIPDFKDYDKEVILDDVAALSRKNMSKLSVGITDVDVLKIDKITAKRTELDIYNLHVQASLMIFDENDEDKILPFTVTLGNLNTSGLS